MSAGLMSCVRENSPPLESPPATLGTASNSGHGTGSHSSGFSGHNALDDIPITITTPEHHHQAAGDTSTTRRKRFHPLRNLRRIFRRRTVSSADATPRQLLGKSQTHIHFATSGCSTTDATLPRTGLGVPITIRADSGVGGIPVGAGFYKRETYRMRDTDDLDKDMSDYQRSLSEGRLVDSDISRDGLSQSHDSVFSESAGTASSLSITLKNELADVLRKRRKDRQHEVSDEDLGLPQSPITPQRKDRGMNKSEGSLSILSMTSSDLDLEERSGSNASGHNLLHLDSSSSSMYNRSSDNADENGADSPAMKLSHSAAKHKLAVRPKKKGPTRARARPRESSVLPATPEVNEDTLKLSTMDIPTDILPSAQEAEEKCHSLPFGINPGALTTSTAQSVLSSSSSTTFINKSASSKESTTINSKLSASVSLTTNGSNSNPAIYVNRNISKSYDFNGLNGEGHLTEEFDLGKKDDDGFFKRILNYSFKKKKHEQDLQHPPTVGPMTSPRKEDNTSTVYITPEPTVKLSLPVCEADVPEMSGYKKIKAGPAARQRVFPKDIFNSEVDGTRESQRYSSNVEVNRNSTSSNGSGSIIISGDSKILQHKSEEYLVSMSRKLSERSFDDEEDEDESVRKYHPHVDKLKNPKIYGLSPYQQRIAKITVNQGESPKESPTKRKAVEKSKSFRVYSDNVSNNLTNSNNLPSLPNLTNSLSIGNVSNNFLETEHKFFSMTENINNGNQKIFKDYITNVDEHVEEGRMMTSNTSLQKFEINDNNLLNPREQEHIDHQPKSIVLTTNTLTPPEPNSMLNKSNQNISQIEETIDKLVSSPFVSIIKDAGSNDRLDQPDQPQSTNVPEFMKIQLNRVDTPRSKTNVVLSTLTPLSSASSTPSPSPALPLSGCFVDESIKTRRFSNENIEISECKPPLPPSAVVVSNRNSYIEAPRSPPAFKRAELGSKRNSVNSTPEISDDRKVILQRRTSVTEEKIKYERRISSSSEDIKIERKKSGSEELLEKRNSNYNSGSSSGDELVVLRKKSIVDNFKDKDKDTPELMKVFARRSLKLRSDEDYRGGESKPLSNVDSDKENQSSEEKLDKIVKTEGATVGSKNGGMTKEPSDGKTTPDNGSNEVLRKSNSKPFGVPNRFGNAANVQGRNTTSFVELRKSLIPNATTAPVTQNNNNSFSKSGPDSIESTGVNGTSNYNNINNNNNSNCNRHTIATMNQFNLNASNNNNSSSTNGNNTTIETIGEVNEFKGILQRRAEWEKRAKEGFK